VSACVFVCERVRERDDHSICIIITAIMCVCAGEKRETTKRVKVNTELTGCRDRGISVRCKRRRGCCATAARYTTTTIYAVVLLPYTADPINHPTTVFFFFISIFFFTFTLHTFPTNYDYLNIHPAGV